MRTSSSASSGYSCGQHEPHELGRARPRTRHRSDHRRRCRTSAAGCRSSASSVAVPRSRHSSTWLRSWSASPRSLSPSVRSAIVVVAEVVGAAPGREHQLVVLAARSPSASRTTFASKSMPATSPIRNRTFGAPRNTLRSGAAMSAGLSRQLRDLVQQRREQVVVAPVDQHHVDGLVAELAGALEPAEAGADDDDTGARSRHRPRLRPRSNPDSTEGVSYLPTSR